MKKAVGTMLAPAFIAGLLFTGNLSVIAAPAASDLLQACEVSLSNGFQGVEGEMCIWYVTPCDCDYGKAAELPRVCIPDTVPTESLARSVVDGLKAQHELQMEDADFAAAVILSRIYPCIESL